MSHPNSTENEPSQKFLQIDEEGFFASNGIRLTDRDYGLRLFETMQMSERGVVLTQPEENQEMIVEAFDDPLVVQNLEVGENGQWSLLLPYGHRETLNLNDGQHQLCLDEWDRFHGLTERGLPFVFSRAAQASFFNLLQDFDDDSITWQGQRIELPPWLQPQSEIENEKFWSDIYQNEEPRWELGEPAKALPDTLAQLKLPRSRVLILGAGSGEDAQFFADKGHLVTAVDFSAEAISEARKKFPQSSVNWVQADAFEYLAQVHEKFDVIFEHTFYCAINPERRTELARLWRQALIPEGHLLGIFFVHPKRNGPPYGGSEWEIRQRLTKIRFQPLYWTRWRDSLQRRMGKELVVYSRRAT